jgi:hypothetical protein
MVDSSYSVRKFWWRSVSIIIIFSDFSFHAIEEGGTFIPGIILLAQLKLELFSCFGIGQLFFITTTNVDGFYVLVTAICLVFLLYKIDISDYGCQSPSRWSYSIIVFKSSKRLVIRS